MTTPGDTEEITVSLSDRSITYTKVVGFEKGIITVTMANGYTDIHWEED